MTVEERFIKKLIDNGMFDSQAKEVMDLAMKNQELSLDKIQWTSDESGYPKTLMSTVWLSISLIALDWIDENLPKAWFRPMFVT